MKYFLHNRVKENAYQEYRYDEQIPFGKVFSLQKTVNNEADSAKKSIEKDFTRNKEIEM